MKIAVATKGFGSQVSGHAGKAHDWLVFDGQPGVRVSTPPAEDCRENLLTELLGRPVSAEVQADPMRAVWASLLAGRALHQGVLNATLGLSPDDFQALLQHYFPGDAPQLKSGPRADMAELDDLFQLLREYRAGLREAEVWMAHSVAYSCCGRDHLWQDLGLANRGELSLLMNTAFPALAALNVGDMKWKKFIYRHYCSREGIYVCPAPSCSECSDYSKCFAKED